MKLKEIFEFLKTFPGIFYSLFLIVFFPLFIFFSLQFTISRFEKNINFILQTEALSITQIFSQFSQDFFSQPEKLQEKVFQIQKENPNLKQVRILKKEKENFKILASQNPKEVGAILEDHFLLLTWSRNEPIANLIFDQNKKERIWKVANPIKNLSGEKIGLVSLGLSLKETDEILTNLILKTFFLMIFGILICIFLVFQHTRLFSYVNLFLKMKEAEKAKNEFIRMATHELQSPVTNIKNYVLELKEMLSRKLTKEEKEFLEVVELSAKNLSELMSDILQVSRIEQGSLDFTPQTLDVTKETEEIVKNFEIQAKQKNLKLIFEKPKEKILILANPYRFKEVLNNLLTNAIKYTFEGEIKVEIKVDFSKKRCYISVEDTGIGISAENQRKIFEKFFREKRKETSGIPGTGLGLWLVKEIMRRSGGDIFFESREGKGSKFTFYFPLVK
jgi:nitrogen-specific signal transduction histidine kinase